MGYYIL